MIRLRPGMAQFETPGAVRRAWRREFVLVSLS